MGKILSELVAPSTLKLAHSLGYTSLFCYTCWLRPLGLFPFSPQISVSNQHPTYTLHKHYLNALNTTMLPAFISWRLVLVCANYPTLCQLTPSLQPSIHTQTHRQQHPPKPAEMKRLWITQLLNFDQSGNKCK